MLKPELFEYTHEYQDSDDCEDPDFDLIVQVTKLNVSVPIKFEVIDRHITINPEAVFPTSRFCEGYLSKGGGAVAMAIGADLAELTGTPAQPTLSVGSSMIVRRIPKEYCTDTLAQRVALLMEDCCTVDRKALDRQDQRAEMRKLTETMEAVLADNQTAERILRSGRKAYRVVFKPFWDSECFERLMLETDTAMLSLTNNEYDQVTTIVLSHPEYLEELQAFFDSVEEL